MAYHDGKAAKMAAPATISHTSLPSQIGPMQLTAMRRSVIVVPDERVQHPHPEVEALKHEEPTQKMAMITNQTLLRCTMMVS